MLKIREQLIEEYLKKPFEIGTDIIVTEIYESFKTEGKGKNKKSTSEKKEQERFGKIISLDPMKIILDGGTQKSKEIIYPSENYKDLKKNLELISINPFKKNYNDYVRSGASFIWQMMEPRKRDYYIEDELEFDFDPYIIKDGKLVRYQRPLVWTIEQKQLFLESIFTGIDCGKVVIRRRDFDEVRNQIKKGIITAHHDIVDGKQRLHTLVEFSKDEFSTKDGIYWSDLKQSAKSRLREGQYLTWGLMENVTDEIVLKVFLSVNHLGTPQSQDHIDFVKGLL